jgi:hypothetical protein
VSGTVAGHVVEARSTCSARTFDCVSDAAEIEFPVKDPSRAELARKLDRVVARAERASNDAAGARMLALVALIVAVVAAALLLLLRMRRKGG